MLIVLYSYYFDVRDIMALPIVEQEINTFLKYVLSFRHEYSIK